MRIIIFTLLCLHTEAFGQFKSYADRLEFMRESEIDVARVALTMAQEFYPSLDVEAYSKKIDDMAEEIRILTKGNTTPDYRIRAMNTYLFKMRNFAYDYADPMGKRPENRFLNGIIDNKKGNCYTLPLLYLSIAQRLRYPIYPVGVPEHLFLRYIDPKLEHQNIEVAGQGGYISDDEHIKMANIPWSAIQSGAYLTTMTLKQFLAEMLATNAIQHAKNKNLETAIKYAKTAIRLSPQTPEHYDLLGRLYDSVIKKHQAGGDPEWAKIYTPLRDSAFAAAKRHGFIDLPDEEYIKKTLLKAGGQ